MFENFPFGSKLIVSPDIDYSLSQGENPLFHAR
jgi:hypothetical protein